MTGSPLRDDPGTMTCPVCQARFTPAGRQRYCTSTRPQAAWTSPGNARLRVTGNLGVPRASG